MVRIFQKMDSIFASLNQVPGGINLPLFETRKALIIINMQNDSFYVKDDLYITKNLEFVPRLKEMIPYFRRYGDIVWVKTHLGVLAPTTVPNAAKVEEESAKLAEKNRQEQKQREQQMKHDVKTEQAREEATRSYELDPIDPNAGSGTDYPTYHPSSKVREMMKQASAETRAEKRSADLQAFDDKDSTMEKLLTRPRKGQQSRFFIAGTRGAEICDELLEVVDESLDLVVTKHHYSAFDQTSLLTALRAKLVTEVYLCGCLTNVGVYSTAADAVQHGLQVTVVEDCLGYRSEKKHEEAMRQMADIMGVHGIDSEEIMGESGGKPVPDAETPGITLDELSIHSPGVSTRRLIEVGEADMKIRQDLRQKPDGLNTVGVEPIFPPMQPLPQGDSSHSLNKPRVITGEGIGANDSSQSPTPGPSSKKNRGSWNLSVSPHPGPKDKIGSGDSDIIYNAVSSLASDAAFKRVKDEVSWQTMSHRGGEVPRLVAVQGEEGATGEMPLYRHPADESPPMVPFSPLIQQIRREAESILAHRFNHALIQLYRDGVDNISEHSDKTLDIVRDSVIVNVSIGAQRIMTLRTKKSKYSQGAKSPSTRLSQRIKMPHNSIFVLGPRTNREWLHGVRADKRPGHEKTEEEKAFGGERISITFRQIGTFIDKPETLIWGTGATGKTKSKANRISNDSTQMEAMINAFGKENHDSDFDWDTGYGLGFDVVNLVTRQARLFLCKDIVANQRVQLSLCEKSISYKATERKTTEVLRPEDSTSRFHPWMHGLSNSDNPMFHDTDENDSKIEGDLGIILYLEKRHPVPQAVETSTAESGRSNASMYTNVAKSNELLFLWRELQDSQKAGRNSPKTNRFRFEGQRTPDASLQDELCTTLERWESQAGKSRYIEGDSWTIIDCAFWPVLNHLVMAFEGMNEQRYPHLLAYHKRVLDRKCPKAILGTDR